MEIKRNFIALISSDWNGCLSPGGPYDPVSFIYPGLATTLKTTFQLYSANEISLGEASKKILEILPGPISIDQMDAYLDKSFITYKGVPDLISWCSSRNILFMINTTGAIGYFQRVFARGLLPHIPILSANPMIRYPHADTDPPFIYDLLEIEDKASNTSKVIQLFNIPAKKVFLVGDSGGDGPHFKWGVGQGSFLIGSMTKPSLKLYCANNGIKIDLLLGISPDPNENKGTEKEKPADFMELVPFIEQRLNII